MQHCVGHMFGLARVTAEPSSFILFGGDAAHHAALLRPNAFTPLPKELVPLLPDDIRGVGAPKYARTFLEVSPSGVCIHHDRDQAIATVETLQAFDARPDVWVLLAHDNSIKFDKDGKGDKGVPLFPSNINPWLERGWKENSRWSFLEQDNKSCFWK
jgi:hypothetical protein